MFALALQQMTLIHIEALVIAIVYGKKMSGNNIDVYLQPLIKELNELWTKGVETCESSLKELFRMRAALMWTISDFPGLCTLSRWNTYIDYACPTFNFDTFPCRLRCSKKWCFMGHRKSLERGYKFRLMKKHFDGTIEERDAAKLLFVLEILKQLDGINVTFESNVESNVKGKRNHEEDVPKQQKKKSIFFNLPYWKDNLLLVDEIKYLARGLMTIARRYIACNINAYKLEPWDEIKVQVGEHEEDDPYIEALQAQMVYYVDDEVNIGWSVVVHMMPRDLYDMGEVGEDVRFES
ncbi:hypothetical protein CR513_28706, partial [Mucuna pruriens]